MKPHRKTQKMSRIRVTAFKKRMRLQKIKKHPKSLASLEYKKNVTNCTIPNKIDKPAEWYADDWYIEMQEKAYKEIKAKTYDAKNNPGGKYTYKGKRKPWYMLDTRKTYRYEERKTKWGTKTDFFRVPSEAAEMYNRTIPKKMTRQEYWEALAQHKLIRWIKKNPRPIKEDAANPDLFEAQYIPEWENRRDKALEHFRDVVVSIYDKLPLSGRFKQSENQFQEKIIAEIKDDNCEGHNINDLKPETSKLLKKTQKVVNKVHAKHANLVSANLKDHRRKKGRIILPEYKQAA